MRNEMKLGISSLIFLLSGLALLACSTGHDFVILNRSRDSIQVTYKWKACATETKDSFHNKQFPAKLTIQDFEQSESKWVDLTPDQFDIDACTVVVNVGSGEALRIYQTFNYRGANAEDSHLHFGIHDLAIAGRNGTLQLEGKQTQNAFKKNRSGDYVIDYE